MATLISIECLFIQPTIVMPVGNDELVKAYQSAYNHSDAEGLI